MSPSIQEAGLLNAADVFVLLSLISLSIQTLYNNKFRGFLHRLSGDLGSYSEQT